MEGQGRKGTLKVLWDERGELHSAHAFTYHAEGPFLVFSLFDGRELRLSATAILKIEEEARA